MRCLCRRNRRCTVNARCLELLEHVLGDLGDKFWRHVGLERGAYSLVDGLRLDANAF